MDSNHPSDHNAIANALTDIINELGSTPRGSAASLSARVADIEANDWVTSARIASGAVAAAELATDAVETAKIKDANVTVAKLAADAVETAKIKDANVTAAKLATDAVETAKIKDGAVTNAKLNTTAGEPGGAWVAFTPVIAVGTHTGTKVGRYRQVGKTVDFTIRLDWAVGDNFTNLKVNLPVTAHADVNQAQFQVTLYEALTPWAGASLVTTTTIEVFALKQFGSTYVEAVNITNSIPFTWSVPGVFRDSVHIAGRYEAA